MSVKQTAETAREKAILAYGSARETAASAGRKAGDGIDEAPLIALIGGLAVGALVAALLPKTAKEDELLGGVGERLTGTARTAVEAAKEAGKARLEELGLTRDAGAETLRSILKGAGDATKASAQAALSAVRDKK